MGTVMLGYQMITSWVPFKKTISYTHIFNGKWSLEGEFAWFTFGLPFAGVDLGSISEKRYSLMAKYYPGNSFHFQIGPYYNDLEVEAGNEILEDISGIQNTTSFGVEIVGLAGGIGNRWQMDNGFTAGIDWLRFYVPLALTEVDSKILDSISQSGDDADVRKVLRRLGRLPTFVMLGINIGYTF